MSDAGRADCRAGRTRRPRAAPPAGLPRNRDDAASLAMDDRDRAAPIALARNAPVSQLEIDLPLALRPVAEALLQPARDLVYRGLDRHAVEKTRIDHHAVAVIGHPVDREGRGVDARRADHRRRAEAVGVDEIEIALVMRGTAENRARPVVHQHEIGDIDRQAPFGVERMNDAKAGVIALLFGRLDRRERRADPSAFLDEGASAGSCPAAALPADGRARPP